MGAVAFEQWAVPDLVLTLGERTYRVRPPDLDGWGQCLALAVRFQRGPDDVPAEVAGVLASMGEDAHPGLGDVWDQLVADKVNPQIRARMDVYATLYWALGEDVAGRVARFLWAPESVEGEPAPKA